MTLYAMHRSTSIAAILTDVANECSARALGDGAPMRTLVAKRSSFALCAPFATQDPT